MTILSFTAENHNAENAKRTQNIYETKYNFVFQLSW